MEKVKHCLSLCVCVFFLNVELEYRNRSRVVLELRLYQNDAAPCHSGSIGNTELDYDFDSEKKFMTKIIITFI
jgi:hypothetical protein